ncbi:DUF3828 domain-containing protein [Xenorhabdus szentirmaii]|uniref:DUF3828 domain-containing protein n=1 Tax=Xenorhabdus szentirmaii TaxID=290112 RepID=UPI0032B7C789
MRRLLLLGQFFYFMAFMFICMPINVYANTKHLSPEQVTKEFYTLYIKEFLSMEHKHPMEVLNEAKESISEELIVRIKAVYDCHSEGEMGECAVEGVFSDSDYFTRSQDAPDEWADVTVETVNKVDDFAELAVILGRGTEYEYRLPVLLEKQSGQWKIILVSRHQPQSAEQIAEAFYIWYMKVLYAHKDPYASDYQTMMKKYVSPKLINQLDEMVDKDYFIKAQDYLDDWRYTTIIAIDESDNRVTANAYIAGLQEKPYNLSVELEKESSQWKIVSVSSLKLNYPTTSYGHIINSPIILNEYHDYVYLTRTNKEGAPLSLIFNDGKREEQVDRYSVNGSDPEVKGFFFMNIAGMRNAFVIVSWKHKHDALKIDGESYEVHAYYYKDDALHKNNDISNDPNLSGLEGFFNDELSVFKYKTVAEVMEYVNKKYNNKHISF